MYDEKINRITQEANIIKKVTVHRPPSKDCITRVRNGYIKKMLAIVCDGVE